MFVFKPLIIADVDCALVYGAKISKKSDDFCTASFDEILNLDKF